MPLFAAILLCALNAQAARLAIVIDDFGYRVHNENKILQMPAAISIAVLPDSPHGREMAQKAYSQGREVLIHLPMSPLSKQPLEKNTLHPAMSREEVATIITSAIQKVPHAVGINNHMGSAMTSNLVGMTNVMSALSQYHFYFLDSVTIGNTQVMKASMGTPVKVLRRNVFLDNVQTEAETHHQLNRAIALARKQGTAIAIGHPYPTTIRALQQELAALPADIELVSPGMLLAHAAENQQNRSHVESKCTSRHQPKNDSAAMLSPELDYLKRVGEALVPGAVIDTLKQFFEKPIFEKSPEVTPKPEELHSAGSMKSQQDNELKNNKIKDKTGARKMTDACADF
ncbi:MAG: divergent polysaccharide deacetylase family protein [Enterobacteriaceae bacterium]|jgi:polysaccharide deacetylase 2 family uncharacterized protein YibQ|nr:divergent polysaccharide deacetylase family protein [Enterobacteriaceae bacterium]